jgi:hypothetical protein
VHVSFYHSLKQWGLTTIITANPQHKKTPNAMITGLSGELFSYIELKRGLTTFVHSEIVSNNFFEDFF